MTRHQFFPACPPFVNTVYSFELFLYSILGQQLLFKRKHRGVVSIHGHACPPFVNTVYYGDKKGSKSFQQQKKMFCRKFG